MVGPSTQPLEIELNRGTELRIRWADGHLSVVPLPMLRQACPCAACRTEREQKTRPGLPVVHGLELQRDMVRAEEAELVGQYGLRLTWKDGHDTGIYDYALLRSLGGPAGVPQPKAASDRS